MPEDTVTIETDLDPAHFRYADLLESGPNTVVLELGLEHEYRRAEPSGGTWEEGGWVIEYLYHETAAGFLTIRVRVLEWGEERVWSIVNVDRESVWLCLFRHPFTRETRTPLWSSP